MTAKRIIVIGSVNTDLVIGAPRIPEEGETITGGDFFIARGGKGANQAVAAARFGGNVAMCGCVGDDSFGKDALDSFVKEKIDVSNVSVVGGVSGGVAVITVVGGNNRIILDSGANASLSYKDVDFALANAESGDVLLTQAENPVDVICYALKKAKEKGMTTVFNPAPASEAFKDCFKYSDYVIPNETEAEIFGGLDEIRKLTDGVIIVTLGSRGYAISDNAGYREYPCIKIKATDTTAAGDTFCGVFAVELADGKTAEDAAKTASVAATAACLRKGAQPSIPTKKEVYEYLNNGDIK